MRFQRTLDPILGGAIKVRILRFLCRKGGEWSGRRIAAELSENPVTAHKALRQLHEEGILDLRKTGSSFVYSLRGGHYVVEEVLKPLFDREAQAYGRLLQILQSVFAGKLKAQVVTAALYGSVLRGEERPASDVDLLVLVRSERAKQQAQDILERLWEEIAERFGNHLALYINTVEEGRQKNRRQLPLFQSILKQHRVIWGKPLEEVLHGRAA